jgi:signal transduction histidine kinase
VTVTVGWLEPAEGTADGTGDGDPGGFYVADNGPGIPPDERPKVFEAGYSTSEDGTGFGLNIVAEVARSHGWEITVTESRAGGARFEFRGVDVED